MTKNTKLYCLALKIILILFVSFSAFSCKKNNEKQQFLSDERAKLRIRVTNISFKKEAHINSKPSVKNIDNKTLSGSGKIQCDTVNWDDEHILIAKLSSDTNPPVAQIYNQSIDNILTKSSTLNSNIAIKYAVHVFDEVGDYVDSKQYTLGKENETSELNLHRDKQYTFVALSINSIEPLPNITFTGSNKTLSNAKFIISGPGTDLMYFKKEKKITGNNENYLDINFNHSFSQINTTIDASATGHSINAIEGARLEPNHNNTTIFNLVNSTIERGGSSFGTIDLSFEGLNTPIIRSTPTIVNLPSEEHLSCFVQSITIGGTKKTNLIFSNNFKVEPGTTNTLSLKIERKDKYEIYTTPNGTQIPTVRINGQIWMRSNLDENRTSSNNYETDPDRDMTNLTRGQFYRWGTRIGIIRPEIQSVTPFIKEYFQRTQTVPNGKNWNPHNTNSADGRSFTPDNNDPCPQGFRIPTVSEINRLKENVIGFWMGSSFVLTSKQNGLIRMIIPAQGYFSINSNNEPFNPIAEGESVAAFWATHDGDDTTPYFIARPDFSFSWSVNFFGNDGRKFLMPVRCIKY